MVMQGYWQNAEATGEALRDGWLHTGDIGEIDADGDITITDRKKDIIVTSGGDNLSPARIEGLLTLRPEIAQAMIYGDGRPHLVALVVADPDWAKKWAAARGKPDEPGEPGRRSGLSPRPRPRPSKRSTAGCRLSSGYAASALPASRSRSRTAN